MDLQFRFRETALKHGVTEADIRHAFENNHVIRQFLNGENVYLLEEGESGSYYDGN